MAKVKVSALRLQASIEDLQRLDALVRLLFRYMPSSIHVDREKPAITYTLTKQRDGDDRIGTHRKAGSAA